MTNILNKRESMDFTEFGKTISSLRKQKKISQSLMSKNLNISRATLSSFENGNHVDIGFKKVIQIADYLGYEI
ncbi:MAG: helix-turn-helix transcriptional regulator, partial [Campylobacterota bacterium]|nr:helix-turn-helix transcriptional regulator [Campylobacterota bacterium]